jgi:hypothetical protein
MKGKCAKLQLQFLYLGVLRSFAAPYSAALVVTGKQAYQRADLPNRTFFWRERVDKSRAPFPLAVSISKPKLFYPLPPSIS